jgi:competence protein ComEA
MKIEKSHFFLGFLIGLCLGIAAGIVAMVLRSRTLPAPIVILPPEATAAPLPTSTPGPLRVFVSGAVASPDVYELPAGSLVADAISQAGGFTTGAVPHRLNLAQALADGMHVHVPAQEETAVAPVRDSGPPSSTAGGLESRIGAPVDINMATLAELSSLPGIGVSTAQKIIEYREANGPFATPADIMRVAGIGQSKFEQIRELITTR